MKKKTLKANVNIVYNFSSLELSEAASSLLNKGLNFCPTPKAINTTQLYVYADLFRMERKFALKLKTLSQKNRKNFHFLQRPRIQIYQKNILLKLKSLSVLSNLSCLEVTSSKSIQTSLSWKMKHAKNLLLSKSLAR
jgi:hypothetical protein